MSQENNQNPNLPDGNEKAVFPRTLALAWELGYSIAVPLVVFALLGRFLDRRYETSPLFLLVGILLAIAASGFIVFKKTKKILEDAAGQ